MKYLCLAYEAEETLNDLSRDDWRALRDETLAYVDTLKANGYLVTAEALQSARTAATVQVRKGHISTTDGPFTETREQLGGFFLIDAENMEAAVRIAGGWPSAKLGSIEVRPVETALADDRRYR